MKDLQKEDKRKYTYKKGKLKKVKTYTYKDKLDRTTTFKYDGRNYQYRKRIKNEKNDFQSKSRESHYSIL